jgi:hypothetical protein
MGNGPPKTSGRSRGGPASHFPGTWLHTNAKGDVRFTGNGLPQIGVNFEARRPKLWRHHPRSLNHALSNRSTLRRINVAAASESSWLSATQAKLCTLEAAGAANSPTVMGCAKKLGTPVLMVYYAGNVPWCGLSYSAALPPAGVVDKVVLPNADAAPTGR